jgi:CBS domain-containing protein
MSARAAARLESLGFTRVYHYKAGKADWLADGWPAEGTRVHRRQAKDLAHKDVPTCHLEDRAQAVQQRIQAAGWDSCVVVNDERVVLGLINKDDLQADPQAAAGSIMQCGPRTYRLNGSIEKIAEYMNTNDTGRVLVTDGDGKLVGMLFQKDLT